MAGLRHVRSKAKETINLTNEKRKKKKGKGARNYVHVAILVLGCYFLPAWCVNLAR